jgi:hypothetical protein
MGPKIRIPFGTNNSLEPHLLAKPELYLICVEGVLCTGSGLPEYMKWPCLRGVPIMK